MSVRYRMIFVVIIVSSVVLFTQAEAQEGLGPSEVSSIAFSPDGSRIAIASGPARCSQENLELFAIRIIDAQSNEVIQSLVRHQCIVNTVAWSPDGSKLASSGEDGLAFIWDVDSAQALSNAENVVRGQPRRGITWSSSGDMVADFIFTGRNTVIWNVETGNIVAEIADPDGDRISAIAWSPDGYKLAIANAASQLQIWDVSNAFSTGQVNLVSSFEDIPTITLAWSPDSNSLAYGTTSGLSILDIQTGRTLQTFFGHTQPVLDIAWKPSGDSLVSGSLDQTIRVWDVLTGLEIRRVQTPSLVGAVAWSPDGTRIAYGGTGDAMEIIPAPSVAAPTPTPSAIPSLTPTPAAFQRLRVTAMCSDDPALSVPNSQRTVYVETVIPYSAGVTWSPDEAWLALYDGTITLLAADSGERVLVAEDTGWGVNGMAWNPVIAPLCEPNAMMAFGVDGEYCVQVTLSRKQSAM